MNTKLDYLHPDSVDAGSVRYVFTVWVDVALDDEGCPNYTGKEMQQHITQALRRVDGDVDMELMETIISANPPEVA